VRFVLIPMGGARAPGNFLTTGGKRKELISLNKQKKREEEGAGGIRLKGEGKGARSPFRCSGGFRPKRKRKKDIRDLRLHRGKEGEEGEAGPWDVLSYESSIQVGEKNGGFP